MTDPVAEAWDRYWSSIRSAGVDSHPSDFTRWCLPFLERARANHLIDLGCGPGRDLIGLLGEGMEVVGVDSSRVAVELARASVARLDPGTARRAQVFHAGVIPFLCGLPGSSIDAVHAAVTYGAMDDGELLTVFDEVKRVLRPSGLHLWSTRGDRHPEREHPERLPPNDARVEAGANLRFLSVDEIDKLTGRGFERLDRREIINERTHSFYLADRRT